MKNIVCIGGGSGISNFLQTFTEWEENITAIINTSDNGGSTGTIRHSYHVPALGDIRKNLSALTQKHSWLEHRFQEGLFAGHVIGNIWLLGLVEAYGFEEWINRAHEILEISKKRKIIPVTTTHHDIILELSTGEKIEWESAILKTPQLLWRVQNIHLFPETKPHRDILSVLETADIILLGPGTFYTSLVPCLLVPGVVETIKNAKAKKVYIANLENFPHESYKNYTLNAYLDDLEKYTGLSWFDLILAHNGSGISDEHRINISTPLPHCTIDNFLRSQISDCSDGKFDAIVRNKRRHDGEKISYWIKKIFL